MTNGLNGKHKFLNLKFIIFCNLSESKTFDVKLNDFQSKTVSRNYYYIDYQQLINLLKYKMYRLRELAEKSLKSSVSDNVCPSAESLKTYFRVLWKERATFVSDVNQITRF